MPPFQPACLRKFAVDASASGTLSIRSRRPSPSPSTANRRYVDGMNGSGRKRRPRSPGFGRDAFVLDDLERGEELALEIRLPAAIAGQGRQRHQQGTLAQGLSVVAPRPRRRHDRRIHAVAGRGALQIRPPALHARLAIGHALVIDQRRHEVPDGRGTRAGNPADPARSCRAPASPCGYRRWRPTRRFSAPAHAAGPGSRQAVGATAGMAGSRSGQRGGQQQRAGSCGATG